MPLKNLSSADVAWIPEQLGITFKRRGKEDVFEGFYNDRIRVVIVPRNKKSIPHGTLASIWRQAGLPKSEAAQLWSKRKKG